jgi:hypothetical protein
MPAADVGSADETVENTSVSWNCIIIVGTLTAWL